VRIYKIRVAPENSCKNIVGGLVEFSDISAAQYDDVYVFDGI